MPVVEAVHSIIPNSRTRGLMAKAKPSNTLREVIRAGSEEPLLVAMQNVDGAVAGVTRGDRAVSLEWSENSVLLLRHE